MTYHRIRIAWLGLALAVAACAGTFTRVPLPTVTSGEERAAGAAAGMLTLEQAERFMHENFYRIVYDEEAHSSGESRDEFVSRMFASETISPTLLTSITPTQLVSLSQRLSAADSYQVSQAVARYQAPLRQRLGRVGGRIAAAAGRNDLVFVLDATQGMNAGALAGFNSRQIAVGPQIVLFTGTEDELAAVLGHEVAHITHGHTRALAIQTLLVGTLQFASMAAVAVANAANCQQGGHCMSGAELGQSMAAVGTVTGVVANGTINATGFNRDEEREADYYGLQYAATAGYRPEDAVHFWQRNLAWERGTGGSFEIPFLRDHPATAERLVRFDKWVSQFRGSATPTPLQEASAPAARPPEVAARVSPPAARQPEVAVPPVATAPSTMATFKADARPCWQTAGSDGGSCTTCCDSGGCHTDCQRGEQHVQQTGTPRPRTCWNADSRIGSSHAVCTTCCTTAVTCSTKCSKVD